MCGIFVLITHDRRTTEIFDVGNFENMVMVTMMLKNFPPKIFKTIMVEKFFAQFAIRHFQDQKAAVQRHLHPGQLHCAQGVFAFPRLSNPLETQQKLDYHQHLV